MLNNELVFEAIADAHRRELLAILAQNSPKTATQLVQNFTITRQGILKHLGVLEEAGLVQVQPRGREKRYSLRPEPLNEVRDWISAIGLKWEERLQRLKTLVESDEVI